MIRESKNIFKFENMRLYVQSGSSFTELHVEDGDIGSFNIVRTNELGQ